MQLHHQIFGTVRVVTISGRIDHDNAEDFKNALQPHLENCKQDGEVVVVNFALGCADAGWKLWTKRNSSVTLASGAHNVRLLGATT